MKRVSLQLAAAVALCPAGGWGGDGGWGGRSQTLHLASKQSAKSLSCSCFLLWRCFSFFLSLDLFPTCTAAGKGGIEAAAATWDTAGWAEYQGNWALEHVSGQISLPLLISPASVSPGKHNIAMWHWNSVNAAGAKEKWCDWGEIMAPFRRQLK